jgi:hypothetical protein
MSNLLLIEYSLFQQTGAVKMTDQLTQKKLHKGFAYDAETGDLIRKHSCRGSYADSKIGFISDRRKRAIIDGVTYSYANLIWLYHKGSFPDSTLDFIDENCLNTRIENLRLYTSVRANEITAEQVRHLFDYNSETGEFFYKNKSSKFSSVGIGDKVVGKLKQKHRTIDINRFCYRMDKLAWLHYYGYYPENVKHTDGDNLNLAIANLEEV